MGREAGDGSGTKGGGGAGDVEGPRAEVGPGHPVPSPARRLFSPTRPPALSRLQLPGCALAHFALPVSPQALTLAYDPCTQVEAAKSRFALDVKKGRGGLVARYARAAVKAPRKYLVLSLSICLLLTIVAMALKAFNLAPESNYDWIVKSDYAVRQLPPAPLPLVAFNSAPMQHAPLSRKMRPTIRPALRPSGELILPGPPHPRLLAPVLGSKKFHGHARL